MIMIVIIVRLVSLQLLLRLKLAQMSVRCLIFRLLLRKRLRMGGTAY